MASPTTCLIALIAWQRRVGRQSPPESNQRGLLLTLLCIGQAALLGEPVYKESVVCVKGCRLLRFKVSRLEQFLDEHDLVRLMEFCQMRNEYRERQLKFNVNARTLLGE